jgi:hypothetical protein
MVPPAGAGMVKVIVATAEFPDVSALGVTEKLASERDGTTWTTTTACDTPNVAVTVTLVFWVTVTDCAVNCA